VVRTGVFRRRGSVSETRTKSWLTIGFMALAACGAGASGLLLSHHDGGWSLDKSEGTAYLLHMCSSRAVPSLSCADVVGSRWGSFDFYLGSRRILVPLSFIGFSYFVMLAIWFAFTGFPGPGTRWRFRATTAVVILGVGASLALSGVMALSLHHWCSLCVIAHVANLSMAMLLVFGYRRLGHASPAAATPPPRGGGFVADRRLAFLGMATSVAAVAGAWMLYETNIELRRYWRKAHGLEQVIEAMQDDAGLTLREFLAQPVRSIPLKESPANDHRPRMIVFRSFESDASACFERDWREEFAAAAGGSLRVEYRHTPLELIEALRRHEPIDDDKSAAARAIEAARFQQDPDGYEDLVTLLFRLRNTDVAPDFGGLARRAGLDADRLVRDMESDAVRQAVRADLELAASLGVDHTPAVFIEGRRVPSLCLKSGTFWRTVAQAPELVESIDDCVPAVTREIVTTSVPNEGAAP